VKPVVEEREKAKKKKEELQTALEKYAELTDDDIQALRDLKEKKSKGKPVDDDVISKKQHELIINNLNKVIEQHKGIIKENLIDNELLKAASEATDPDLIVSFFKNRFNVVERDGKYHPVYSEKEYDDMGNVNTPQKVVKEWLDGRSHLRKPTGKNGTGTQLNQNPNIGKESPTLDKSEVKTFSDLAPGMSAILKKVNKT
jgi:hypothetical protein